MSTTALSSAVTGKTIRLSNSGYAPTVVLNYQSGVIAGVASNEKTWTPIHRSFEVVA